MSPIRHRKKGIRRRTPSSAAAAARPKQNLEISNDWPFALISVSDKRGIGSQALLLEKCGYQIISTGGTAKVLREAGVKVLDIAELRFRVFANKMKKNKCKVVGQDGRTIPMRKYFERMFPTEMLGHRVASLHAEVQGGILAAMEMEDEIEELGFPRIELVFVDLYDLQSAIDDPKSTLRDIQDKIDIGGVTLLRGAAKNGLIVGSSYEDREEIVQIMMTKNSGMMSWETKQEYAARTFARMAQYDLIAARFLRPQYDGFILEMDRELIYGENRHQAPAFLWRQLDSRDKQEDGLSADMMTVPGLEQLQGAAMSYNNACDASRLIDKLIWLERCLEKNCKNESDLTQFNNVAIVSKHTASAGIGVSLNPFEAVKRMLSGDPVANHGGMFILNFLVNKKIADLLLHYLMTDSPMRLIDGIIAPEFDEEAMDILKRKGENKLRLLKYPLSARHEMGLLDNAIKWTRVRGGFISQPPSQAILNLHDLGSRGYEGLFVPDLDHQLLQDMCIAQTASHNDPSNTIAAAKNGMLLASACGQQDRLMAARLLLERCKRAGHSLEGAVVSSDSFFPFPDAPELLAEAGVGLILTTSGALTGDAALRKVILKRHEAGLPHPGVIMIPDKIARGFSGHSG